MNQSQLGNTSTESEMLFEEYLTAQGYTDWTHEQPIEGKPTTPDYRLQFKEVELYFDVKEFDAAPPSLGFGTFDPYSPVREKINRAARQFKHYKEFSCSVVLSNPKGAFVLLDSHEVILGAMLGDMGFQIRLGPSSGIDNTPVLVFTQGGKMINDKRQEPQNTTISSVIVLDHYLLRKNFIRIAKSKREEELGRKLTPSEFQFIFEACSISGDTMPLRATVYENPYARIPCAREIFHGSFDEVWGLDGEHVKRLYVGEELQKIEKNLDLE